MIDIIKSNPIKSFDDSPYKYSSKFRDDNIEFFVSNIKEKDLKITTAQPFKHFKDFQIYYGKSLTLYGEGGLGLDMINQNSLKQYKGRGELCYPIESIPLKFNFLGMLVRKDEMMYELAEKVKQNLTDETDFMLQSSLISSLYALSYCHDCPDVILDIQKELNIDIENGAFITTQQVSNRLKTQNATRKLKETEKEESKNNIQARLQKYKNFKNKKK